MAYNQFLQVCRENGDSTSAKLFTQIIDDEQIHLNFFENINRHIENLDGTYLAKVAGTSSSTGLQPQGFAINESEG